jgi:hypothetical protein
MMAQLPSKNEDPQRKYHGTVKIPPETHIETADQAEKAERNDNKRR